MVDVKEMAGQHDFECVGSCTTEILKTRPEVRDMCAADRCRAYNRSWACPPACGSIEEYEAQMHQYDNCIVVQSVGQLEDSFDFETVEETAKIHDSRFLDLVAQLRETDLEFMPLGAGTCLICPECTYPDAPCRYPDKQIVSMEAAGLVVNDVCKQADIPYNHGQDTIQFSSCILY